VGCPHEPFCHDRKPFIVDLGEWQEGASPSRSRRTRREPLDSPGSHRPAFRCAAAHASGRRALAGSGVQRAASSHSHALAIFPRSRLNVRIR